MEYQISKINATQLAKQYGTPLYVYDEQNMVSIMKAYKDNFVSSVFDTNILFASKAFSCAAMYKLCSQYGLGADVVSGGELYTALKGGMNPDNIYFHGNNKTEDEIRFAINSGVTHIVVDNVDELKLLIEITNELQKQVCVLFRLNCGVEAHTHKYIVTSHVDSKFGMLMDSKEIKECVFLATTSSFVQFSGFHSHIGSQIFEMDAFYAAIDKLVSYLKNFDEILTLNIGGGFGVRYTDEDHPIAIDTLSKALISYTEQALEKNQVTISKLIIEPGRSIVGESGYTLYTIGNQKETPNKKYYFIDGGMADNIRPALYQAKYDALIANRVDEEKTESVCIAGKCCESGDIIIENILLPKAQRGDILVVKTTGAYGYSMSSHYNLNLKPAVVFVKDGKSRVVIERETYKDLLAKEVDSDYELC